MKVQKEQSPATHCGHGVRYIAVCRDCEKLWAEEVTIPLVTRLLKRAKKAGHPNAAEALDALRTKRSSPHGLTTCDMKD